MGRGGISHAVALTLAAWLAGCAPEHLDCSIQCSTVCPNTPDGGAGICSICQQECAVVGPYGVACTPSSCITQIAAPDGIPASLAVHGDSLYAVVWAADAGINAPFNGHLDRIDIHAAESKTVAMGLERVPNLAVDDSVLAWADNWLGTLQRMPLDGGPVDVISLVSPDASPFPAGVAVSGGHTYWVDADEGTGVWDIADNSETTTEIIAGSGDVIASDGTDLFWIDRDGVWSASVDGGAPFQISTQVPLITTAIAVDSANVYMLDAENLVSVPKTGGAWTTVASTSDTAPFVIAVDDDNVYYAGLYTVSRVPKDGGPPVSLVPIQYPVANGLAVDDTSVYFSDSFDNLIWKITPK